MDKIYMIENSSYDGCNGWTTCRLKDLLFSTKEKAQEWIDRNYYSGSRYKIVEENIR